MNRAFTVALREVRSYLQDKADLAFSLLLPIAIFALIYGAFGGETSFSSALPVVNEDTGAYSAQLLDRLRALEGIDVQLLSAADANAKLNDSTLLMVTFIPSDFSARLAAGQPTQLTFKERGNGGQASQIVAAMVRGVVTEMNQTYQVQAQVEGLLAGQEIPEEMIRATVEKFVAREESSPLVGVAETTVGSKPDPVSQFLPGILTMFVLFAITLTGQTIVEERRNGTLERLLTTRLTGSQLFAGKFLAGLLRGFVQTVILLVLSWAVFQLFTPLSFLWSLIIALVFAAAASAVGLVIASIARTPDQATWIAVVVTMVTVLLSGTFFQPAAGTLFARLEEFSLNTYANRAFVAIISKGDTIAAIGNELAVIGGVLVVALIVARLLFKAVPGGR